MNNNIDNANDKVIGKNVVGAHDHPRGACEKNNQRKSPRGKLNGRGVKNQSYKTNWRRGVNAKLGENIDRCFFWGGAFSQGGGDPKGYGMDTAYRVVSLTNYEGHERLLFSSCYSCWFESTVPPCCLLCSRYRIHTRDEEQPTPYAQGKTFLPRKTHNFGNASFYDHTYAHLFERSSQLRLHLKQPSPQLAVGLGLFRQEACCLVPHAPQLILHLCRGNVL